MTQPPAGFEPTPSDKDLARSWDWEKDGDTIQGDYHGSRDVETKHGEQTLHTIVTETEEVVVWGKTVLNRELAKVAVGQEVWIHRLGKTKTASGNEFWDFEVFVKPVAA